MSDVKAADYGLKNPVTDEGGVTTWDCICFGNYCQSDPLGGTKEPIKWRVLSVNGNDAFLLADQNLDLQPYHTEYEKITWEDSILRRWLNTIFMWNAFTKDEQNAVIETKITNDDNPYYGTEGGNETTDKVFLLSIAEVCNTAYGFNASYFTESQTRESSNTAYISSNEWMWATGESDRWWLRSPGQYGDQAAYVAREGSGSAEGSNITRNSVAVRPALHLDLSVSYAWSYAGVVRSKGGGGESAPVVTPTPAPNTSGTTPLPTAAPGQGLLNNSGGSGSTVTTVKKPAKVKLKSVKNKKGKKLAVVWKKVSAAKGYQLQYACSKKFKNKKSVFTKKKKYTVKKCKKKTYYVRVRAYKTNGSKKVYGKWSATKKVKIKK